jgi:hypothetical protein
MADPIIIPLVNIPPDVYDRPYSIVQDQVAQMNARADTALNTTYDELTKLSNVQMPQEGTPPDLKPLVVTGGDIGDVTLPSAQLFGRVPDFIAPAFEDFQSLIDGIGTDPPPTWDPSIISINIPDAPAPIDYSGAPERPDIAAVVLPDAPDTTMPAVDQLLTIDIPDRPTITLPTFDAVVPTFDDPVPALGLDWAEPSYSPTVLNDVATTVRAMLAGDFAMPTIVQNALFGAAREREDMTAHKATQDAFDDYAGRGFSMPPGMLVAQVNAVREANQLAVNSLSRDVFTKAAEWQIENLRQAVQQGIALETVLINQFDNMARRSFELARQRVQVEFDRYNLRVSAFNAQMQSVDKLVRVFQTKVQAELSKLEIFKAEIEAEQLKTGVNEATVRIYTARLQALSTTVEIFKAKVDAVRVAADLERGKIDMYRVDVQAWSEKITAEKTRFDAYATQVAGESSKANILEAEARAFASTVQAYETGNNVKIQVVQARLRAIETGTTKFLGLVQAEREQVQAGVSQLQAAVSTFAADTGRYSAQANFEAQKGEVAVRATEANARNNVAYFEVLSRQFDSRMQRMIEQARILLGAIQAAGGMASQLAAGAMSATHVAASISGSGSASLSASNSYSVSNSLNSNDDDSSSS